MTIIYLHFYNSAFPVFDDLNMLYDSSDIVSANYTYPTCEIQD